MWSSVLLRSVFGKALWDGRRGLLGWSLGLAGVAAMYAAFYPSASTPDMARAIQSYPESVKQLFSMQDMTSPAGYLGASVFNLLGVILLVVFAISGGARAVAGDEEAGTLDLVLAHPVGRGRLVVQRFLALAAQVVVICAAVLVVLLAIASPTKTSSIGAGNLAAATAQLALLGMCFGALALAVGAATGRRSAVIATCAAVAVVAYFGNTLAPRVHGLGWLPRLSPFHYYSDSQPLRHGLDAGDSLVLIAATALLVAVAALAFTRRDVATG
jgi:ABC-2 type transport system permease protein